MPCTKYVSNICTKKGLNGKLNDIKCRKISEEQLRLKKYKENEEVRLILLRNGLNLSEIKR
jgi:hypothetical protein